MTAGLIALVGGFALGMTALAGSERPGVVEGGRSVAAASRGPAPGSIAVVPISIEVGAVIIEARINGRGPFPFMFDSGGGDALTPEAVAALGLQAQGKGTIQDSAGRVVPISFTTVETVRLDGIEMRDQPFMVLPLPKYLTDRGMQTPIAGVIGYELLANFAVRLDYDNRTLTISPGSDSGRHANGAEVPLLFRQKTPMVKAAADGFPGIFAIDTGSTGALTLGRKFVEEHGLGTRHSVPLRIRSLGASGPFEMMLTRLDSFEVAGSRIERPAARFAPLGTSRVPTVNIDGGIGYEILRQFVITIDCGQRKVWFERSRAFGARTGQGGAGFQAVRVDGVGFRVITVVPHAAAAAGGLKIDDVITAIDGRPTQPMSLAEMAELMRRPAGTSVQLSALRDGSRRRISLTLEDLLP
jgi:hypothetical protein